MTPDTLSAAETSPHNADAELAVLGAVLTAPEMYEQVHLTAEDFFLTKHRQIWNAISAIKGNGHDVDLITVGDELERRGILEEVGGSSYLTALIARPPSSMHAASYGKVIRELAEQRDNLALASAIAKSSNKPAAVRKILRDALELSIPEDDLQIWSGAELEALELTDTPWLLPDIILQGGLMLLAGEVGSGKSWLLEDLGIAAAVGGEAWGKKFSGQCGVLFLGADSNWGTLARRYRALTRGRGVNGGDQFHLMVDPLNLANQDDLARLQQIIRDIGARLVIIDTFAAYVAGLDENQAADMAPLFARLRTVANAAGVTFMLAHHLNKPQGFVKSLLEKIRGSVAIPAAVDTAFVLTARKDGAEIERKLTQVKNREGDPLEPVTFAILPNQDGGMVLAFGAPHPQDDELRRAILEVLHTDNWLNTTALHRFVGGRKASMLAGLAELKRQGLVESRTGPRSAVEYRICSQNREQVGFQE